MPSRLANASGTDQGNRSHTSRKFPIGAELTPEGVHFRVWADSRKRVQVVVEGESTGTELERDPDGYFSGWVPAAKAGSLYRFKLDGGDAFPDPASRFQPQGPHGPSQVVDPSSFAWSDSGWKGAAIEGQVVYEMHVGTFTPEGTWKGAAAKLPYLAETGVTVLELMPIAEFPGEFGWGYDGVQLFAPAHIYGSPDEFRAFVDRAHALGLAVILDVVYNHLGPDGNYLAQFAPHYFTEHHHTDWGAAINYDDDVSVPVREFFLTNAAYWIDEYHLDGLRLDATQDIHDDSKPHILADITRAVRKAAGKRKAILIGENEPQHVQLVKDQDKGGYGLDALWNDDLHHAAMVRLTGRKDAYYTDYLGTPQEFISSVKYGYLYQGQHYKWQKARRGTSSFGIKPASFVTFIQNHDQIANSARGQRVHQLCSPGAFRAMTALILLGPGTPMLFQGQEFCASSPFLYFADHKPELAELVKAGRRKFLQQWRSLCMPQMEPCFADPADRHTFERCILDHSEAEKHKEMYALHRDLLKLRREDPVIRAQRPVSVDGAVLSTDAFALRFFSPNHGDRLLIVNFGVDLELSPSPEPLLAPQDETEWHVLWSTEAPAYGGCGQPELETAEGWMIAGQAAVLLKPISRKSEKLPHARKDEEKDGKENNDE